MAKREKREGFWPRFLITLVVVIWVALVGGNWLGHVLVKRFFQDPTAATTETLNFPSARPKPWRTADPSMQREVDEQRGGGPGPSVSPTPGQGESPGVRPGPEATPLGGPAPASAEVSEVPEEEVAEVDAPEPEATAEPLQGSSAPEPAGQEPPPTPALEEGEVSLQFGSFSSQENAQALVEKLARKGQLAEVEAVYTEGGRLVYRVQGGGFQDEASARAQAERLRDDEIEPFIRR